MAEFFGFVGAEPVGQNVVIQRQQEPVRTRIALPGAPALTTAMMKNLIKKKGVASVEELREMAIESDVNMIACQMTLDLFEYKRDDLIDGVSIGGAASWVEVATKSEINLYI